MKKIILIAVAAMLITFSIPAEAAKSTAGEIQELKALVQKLAARVEELETREANHDKELKTVAEKTVKAEKTIAAAQLGNIEPAAGTSRHANAGGGKFNWSGPYAGAFLGLNQVTTKMTVAGVESDPAMSGFSGGLLVGYNRTYNSDMLLGIEGEAALADLKSDINLVPGQQKITNTFAVRGRLGRIFNDNNLLFLSAGVSAANYDADIIGGPSLLSEYLFGGQAGFGFEQAITDRMTWRADYLFTLYKDETSAVIPGLEFNPRVHIARIGIGYKF